MWLNDTERTVSVSNSMENDILINALPSAHVDGQFTSMVKQIRTETIQDDLEYETESTNTSYRTKDFTSQASSPQSTLNSTVSPGSPTPAERQSPPQPPSAAMSSAPQATTLMEYTLPSDNICHVAPCRAKKFNSIDDLRAHDYEAHRYRCQKGCQDVGYPSLRDLGSRHYGPVHGVGQAPYVCGRCGKSDPRQDNHTRHLERVRPCRAKPVIQQYTCGRCGDKTYEKEKHLQHLRRRGCQPTQK